MARILLYGSTIMTLNAFLLLSMQLESGALITNYHRSPQLQVHSVHGNVRPTPQLNLLGKSVQSYKPTGGLSTPSKSDWYYTPKTKPIVPSDLSQNLLDTARRAQDRQQKFEANYNLGVAKLMAGDVKEARQTLGRADNYAERDEKGNVGVLLAMTEDNIDKSEKGLEASLQQANRKDVLAVGNLTLGLIKFDNWIAGKGSSPTVIPFLEAAIKNGAEPSLPNLIMTEIAISDGNCSIVKKRTDAGFSHLAASDEETIKVLLADAYYARGACYHEEALGGQAPQNLPKMTPLFEQATKDYERSLSYFELSEVLVSYATISYHQMHKPEQAKRQFERAIVLDVRNDLAYYNLACYYSLTGNIELAVENLRKAIQLNPEIKKDAAADSDFNNSRSHVGFQHLIR